MAIALDRCIQKTYSTATRNLECSLSLDEMVVLKVKDDVSKFIQARDPGAYKVTLG